MTLFAALLASLGLSQSEAAAFLNVRPDTVKSWSAGRNRVKPEIFDELRALAERQRQAAEAMARAFEEARARAGPPERIEIALPSDREIAQRGWPSRRAFLAAVALAWRRLPPGVTIDLVPSGSTAAVRAAERARKFAG